MGNGDAGIGGTSGQGGLGTGTGGVVNGGGTQASGGQSEIAAGGMAGTLAGGIPSTGGKTALGGNAGTKGSGGNAGGTASGGSGVSSDAGARSKDLRDANGTEPIVCSDPTCDIYCPYGYVLDVNGCPTCQCKVGPTDASAGTDAINCGATCEVYCPYGYEVDVNGCPTCKCNADPVVCPAIECTKICPNGYVLDTNGCQTCDCASSTSNPSCGQLLDFTSCSNTNNCTWLEPGCDTPSLAAAGCYDNASIGCTSDNSCPDGHACLKRIIDPCAYLDCLSCAQTISLCL
jgi:hypothetical protein